MYQFLCQSKYDGVEIAPSRVFGENPYEQLEEARKYKNILKENYNLDISSMQSIWYGKNSNIFYSKDERKELFEYTKQVIEFANVIECKNLVFGCPRNRNIPNLKYKEEMERIFIDFMYNLGEYAHSNNTTISLEANPTIYNTNFINYTKNAFEIIKKINSKGIAVNLDTGTVIYNNECISDFGEFVDLINHIHFSEPYLKAITFNNKQIDIIKMFSKLKIANRYYSIEMGKTDDIETIKNVITKFKNIVRKVSNDES